VVCATCRLILSRNTRVFLQLSIHTCGLTCRSGRVSWQQRWAVFISDDNTAVQAHWMHLLTSSGDSQTLSQTQHPRILTQLSQHHEINQQCLVVLSVYICTKNMLFKMTQVHSAELAFLKSVRGYLLTGYRKLQHVQL